MSEIKFSCPKCQQHLEADEAYAGTEITCPTCQVPFIISVSGIAAPPRVPTPPPLQGSGSSCPSCGVALARGAVLCVQCGYNLSTKQRMVAGKVVAPGKPSSDQWETPWYQTALPYVGVLVVLLALLYFWGRTNERAMMAFAGIAVVYVFCVHVIVAIDAFKESTGTGMLALCIPFYALYYVFKEDNPNLKVLYIVAFILNFAIKFLPRN